MRLKRLPSKPRICLALQGGGAHGAFTWGVLDFLLEASDLQFEGVSGTSAGAMNAVVLADGLMKGGRDGARAALAEFWREVAASVPFEVAVRTLDGESVTLTPAMKMMMGWTSLFSPYELNPFDLNPLRKLVTRMVDFERLRRRSPVKLFIAATAANTGRLRLFKEHELTVDSILASACLPSIHHSVEIDGEPYWDGGFTANPAVFPLFYECPGRDILLVLINPLRHRDTPRSAEEIRTRSQNSASARTSCARCGCLPTPASSRTSSLGGLGGASSAGCWGRISISSRPVKRWPGCRPIPSSRRTGRFSSNCASWVEPGRAAG